MTVGLGPKSIAFVLGTRPEMIKVAPLVKIFGELFSRANAHDLDLDVDVRNPSREPDQLPSEVHDVDLLSHLEREDFTTRTQGPRLQDQLNRFVDAH